ncbi:hypothetical protein Nmel_002528 [Mimus melanotis]
MRLQRGAAGQKAERICGVLQSQRGGVLGHFSFYFLTLPQAQASASSASASPAGCSRGIPRRCALLPAGGSGVTVPGVGGFTSGSDAGAAPAPARRGAGGPAALCYWSGAWSRSPGSLSGCC